MSVSSRTNKNRGSKGSSFLPQSLHAFLARRLVELSALLLAGLALFLWLAFISYDAGDPSFNTSVSKGLSVENWMGLNGAYIADIGLQSLGYAVYLLPLILLGWSARLFQKLPIEALNRRLLSLFGGVIAASLALSPWPDFLDVGYPASGALGVLFYENARIFIASTVGRFGDYFITTAFTLLALLGLAYASHISRARWVQMGQGILFGLLALIKGVIQLVRSFMGWVNRYGLKDDKAQATTQLRKTRFPIKAWVATKLSAWQERRAEKEETRIDPVLDKRAQTVEAPKKPLTPPKLRQAEPESEDKETQQRNFQIVAPQKVQTQKQSGPAKTAQSSEGFTLPALDLLQMAERSEDALSKEELEEQAERLQDVLEDFGIKGEIVKVHPGPVVTLYELEPAPGTKSSRVISLSEDIARSMEAISVRAAVIPGKNAIGIEIPNHSRETVFLRELLSTKDYSQTKCRLPLVLGKDIGGHPIIADLAKMPHLLVAGTTGSGKSVAVNTMILSLLYNHTPDKCRFIMVDPKMLELSIYDGIPHLLSPVVTEPGKAVVALKWAVREMEERYRAMSKLGVRNIDGYNQRIKKAIEKGEVLTRKVQTGFDADTGKPVFEEQPIELVELPYIVIIVDEFADLMMVAGKDVEAAIQRLAQMARAAGLHLIMATQRPSVDVVTGTVKANFPSRISFQVSSKIDSRTILGESGAEHLLGMGDMLYMASGGRVTRVHGPFASDAEVEDVVKYLKTQGAPNYVEDVTDESSGGGDILGLFGDEDEKDGYDELYDEAVAIVAREQKASTSYLQRQLQIGYNRAARIIEQMEKDGVVGKANHVGKREILIGER